MTKTKSRYGAGPQSYREAKHGEVIPAEEYDGTGSPAEAAAKQVGGNHYKNMAITPTHYIVANKIGWLEGNAIKYISRYKDKNGVEDLDKAIHYIELIKEEYLESN